MILVPPSKICSHRILHHWTDSFRGNSSPDSTLDFLFSYVPVNYLPHPLNSSSESFLLQYTFPKFRTLSFQENSLTFIRSVRHHVQPSLTSKTPGTNLYLSVTLRNPSSVPSIIPPSHLRPSAQSPGPFLRSTRSHHGLSSPPSTPHTDVPTYTPY